MYVEVVLVKGMALASEFTFGAKVVVLVKVEMNRLLDVEAVIIVQIDIVVGVVLVKEVNA